MPSISFPPQEDVYRRHLTLTYGSTAEINKVLRAAAPNPDAHRALLPGTDGNYRVYWRNGLSYSYISVLRHPYKCHRLHEIATLSHEVLHHAFFVMESAGALPSPSSEECYTYYHQWVFQRCLDQFWK